MIFAGCFGALWWRLGAGPINLEMATPWLAQAIAENIGNGNTVEVGGTQIERAGKIRIAVRIRDIIVRDRDHAIVASAPKAEVRLSGSALLMGRLRAESLNLVDAELSVRITPDGYVTVSTGGQCTAARNRRRLEERGWNSPHIPPPRRAIRNSVPLLLPFPRGAVRRRNTGHDAKRVIGGPRLARQPEPDRIGRTESQRIGLKNGNLIVDDQQRGNKRTFQNITLSLRRPSGGGVAPERRRRGQ